MKLLISCPKCICDKGSEHFESACLEIRNDGLYEFKCSRGHENIVALQNQKFEILFEFGAMAFKDGYNREAIANFAAAIERFHEFYIKVICLKHGVSLQHIKKTWKLVANQSERQLGAFLFLYLLDHRQEMDFLVNEAKPSKCKGNWQSFRNRVIHKGYMPSAWEVLEYGDLVYKYLYDLIDDLNKNSAEWKRRICALESPMSADGAASFMMINSLLNPSIKKNRAPSLEDALKKMSVYRNFLYKK